MLGTKYVKNKIPSLYAEKRACSTSFHGNFSVVEREHGLLSETNLCPAIYS